jgi:hypothetical protein
MTLLQKGTCREERGYMWGCVLRTHPHIYPHSPLASSFFSELDNVYEKSVRSGDGQLDVEQAILSMSLLY